MRYGQVESPHPAGICRRDFSFSPNLYIPPPVAYTEIVHLFLIMIRFLIQKVSLPIADFFRTFLYVAPNAPLFSLPKLKLAPQRIRLKRSPEPKNWQSDHEPFA